MRVIFTYRTVVVSCYTPSLQFSACYLKPYMHWKTYCLFAWSFVMTGMWNNVLNLPKPKAFGCTLFVSVFSWSPVQRSLKFKTFFNICPEVFTYSWMESLYLQLNYITLILKSFPYWTELVLQGSPNLLHALDIWYIKRTHEKMRLNHSYKRP